MGNSLEALYRKEAHSSLDLLKSALERVEKDPSDTAALESMAKASHNLKGNSLQMGFYLVAYMARQVEELSDKLLKQGHMPEENTLAFMADFIGSLDKCLTHAMRDKEYKVDVILLDRLEKILSRK